MDDSFSSNWLFSEFWLALTASAGGVVVLAGLWMEMYAEKFESREKWDSRFEYLVKSKHWCDKWGQIAVMIGVSIEVIVGAAFAVRDDWQIRQININEARDNPMNQLVSDVSLSATINMAGTNLSESPLWGAPAIAYANLCEKIPTNIPVSIYTNMEVGSYNSWGVEFSQLQTFEVRRINYMDQKFVNVVGHGYNLQFKPDPFRAGDGFIVSFPPKVSDIVSNIACVRIDTKFIPHDSEVAGGSAYLTINGTVRMRFKILPQKALSGGLPGGDFEPGFSLVATNGTLAPLPLILKK